MHDYLLKIEIGVENKSQLLLLNKIKQYYSNTKSSVCDGNGRFK